jgi:hypothetical protein
MPKIQWHLSACCQQLYSLRDIPYLPSVEFLLRKLFNLLLREILVLLTAEKWVTHTSARLETQPMILKREMDARFESCIDILDAVAGQKEEALIVFQDSEENGDTLVPCEVGGRTSFDVDVCLVEQENRSHSYRHLGYHREGSLNFFCIGPRVSCCYYI